MKKQTIAVWIKALYATPQHYCNDIDKYWTGGWNGALDKLAEKLGVDNTEAQENFKKNFKG